MVFVVFLREEVVRNFVGVDVDEGSLIENTILACFEGGDHTNRASATRTRGSCLVAFSIPRSLGFHFHC